MKTLEMKLCLMLFFSAVSIAAYALPGDSMHVISHNKTLVVTDPSTGENSYKTWSVFPSSKTSYRKAILYVTYGCPDNLHCGEWDYIDKVVLCRSGGLKSDILNYEIARVISPYGWRFDNGWQFTWHIDISDFAPLLHDSVEMNFIHTGYESNKDRGWLVTLDFKLIEGTPHMQQTGIQKLWNGSFPYGDSLKSIEEFLTPLKFKSAGKADLARMRILQTGHGMDDLENCAEFCAKYRDVIFDKKLVERKKVWRKCGDNPLYPQAGTWIFDRANWCPGAIVYPDVYDFRIKTGKSYTVDIDMEPYINRNKPTANYCFSSFVFFYKQPWAMNDVSLEEIVSPNSADEFSRTNPACANAEAVIRNNGKDVLRNLKITYGADGKKSSSFNWKGHLKPSESTQVILPGDFISKESEFIFTVNLSEPNGKKDEYEYDNVMSKVVIRPYVCKKFIVAFRTNKDSTQTLYKITNSDGVVVSGLNPNLLNSNTLYLDTFDLAPGCYTLSVDDTAGDGLDFWFNPEGGYGYIRLLDANSRLLKSFSSDFGSKIIHNFIVSEELTASYENEILPIVNPFPVRNSGKFVVDVFLNVPQNILISIENDSGYKVYENIHENFKEGIIDLDISSQIDGFYFVKVVTSDGTVERKVRLKRD